MFYRKDLLEKYGKQPPKTWDELAATAKEIQDKERADGKGDGGAAWQAKSYEGLTCDADHRAHRIERRRHDHPRRW